MRYTYYNEEIGSYLINTEKKPWTLEYWDLVNIIGQLEDKLDKLEGVLNAAND